MTEHAPSIRLPPELLLAILNHIPTRNDLRTRTICSSRLACRAWSELLLPLVYRNAEIYLTKKKSEAGDRVRDLTALCTFFAHSPEVCACVRTLWVNDETSFVPKKRRRHRSACSRSRDVGSRDDEDTDAEGEEQKPAEDAPHQNQMDDRSECACSDSEDSDEDDEGWMVYRCDMDPTLLRRTLAYLPHLQELRLRHVMLGKPLDRHALAISPSSGERFNPLILDKLRVTLPGWSDDVFETSQLLFNAMSIVDGAPIVRFNVGYEDTKFLFLETDSSEDAPRASPYKVKSFSAMYSQDALLSAMAQHPAFKFSLSTLHLDSVHPDGVVELLSTVRSTLTCLSLEVAEPPLASTNPDGHATGPVLDLSASNALTDLTLQFHLLTDDDVRHARMSAHICETLSSILRRMPGAPAFQRFVLRIVLAREEVSGDGTWAVSVDEARAIEDVLLQLHDAGAYRVIELQYDVQQWYASEAFLVRVFRRGWDELATKLEARLRLCERILRERFGRLERRGALEIEAVSVSFLDARYVSPSSFM